MILQKIIDWFGFGKKVATLTHECNKCKESCDIIISLGRKKEHYYLNYYCSDCKESHYISFDKLKYKPKS